MPEPSTASVAHTYTAIELTQTGAILKSGSFFETIGKTVLKLPDPAILQQLTTAPPSLQAIEAMQRLVELVAKLRSPDGGCPNDLEPNPANLAPYLSEETQEVLEALQAGIPCTSYLPPPPLLSIEDLIPQLLWSLAHSSYQVVQLIEGVSVSSQLADQSWQGMLRLVTLLEAETSDRHWAIDLVTHKPPSSDTLPDTTVQIHWHDIGLATNNVPGTSTQQLLEELTRSLSNSSPLVRALLNGLAVGLLEPEKGWQSGQLWLKLSFELIVDQQDEVEIEPTLDSAVPVSNASLYDGIDALTLEEFANGVELVESQSWLDTEDNAGVTLADFTGDMVAAIASTDSKETRYSKEIKRSATLEGFVIGLESAIEPLDFSLGTDEIATLEEFALGLEQTMTTASSTVGDAFLPGTLADFVIEMMQPEPALVEVLSAEPMAVVDEPQTPQTVSQTIEVASIEIPPVGADLFEQWDLAYTTQTIATSEAFDEASVPDQTNPEPTIILRLVDPALQALQAQQSTQHYLIEALKPYGTVPLDELPFRLVEQAWEVGERLASHAERSPERFLQAWLPEILWQITRASYEVMQLVGGLTANVLQPHWGWKLGTLRLLPLLRIQTADLEWALDVVTGQPLQPSSLPLDPNAIVRLTHPCLGTQPMLAEALFGKAIEQIQAKAPEIQQLMDGICIEVCFADENWQAAKLQLYFNLELITE